MSPIALEKLLRTWQDRLGLNHWRIELDLEEPALEHAYASTWRSNDYDKATIRFDPDWPSWSKETLAEHIVHELLHLQMRDTEQSWALLNGLCHRDAYDTAEQAFDHAVEGVIDRLSLRIVALAS